ncbi:hypothetical protein, partial [Ligilactobacillus salivarius]|uniref:hypothetical protein n=1 Tax=Ligilactobacillus salivarius TaxID=1624 RepID=UPI001CDD47CB
IEHRAWHRRYHKDQCVLGEIEHEHKLMRQAQLLQERIKQETLYKQKQRKLQRLREREHLLQQNRKQSVTKPTLKATTHKHIEDDGPEL